MSERDELNELAARLHALECVTAAALASQLKNNDEFEPRSAKILQSALQALADDGVGKPAASPGGKDDIEAQAADRARMIVDAGIQLTRLLREAERAA